MIGAASHRPAILNQHLDQLPSRQSGNVRQLGHARVLLLSQGDRAYERLEEGTALPEVVGAANGEFDWRHRVRVGLYAPFREEPLPLAYAFEDFEMVGHQLFQLAPAPCECLGESAGA